MIHRQQKTLYEQSLSNWNEKKVNSYIKYDWKRRTENIILNIFAVIKFTPM